MQCQLQKQRISSAVFVSRYPKILFSVSKITPCLIENVSKTGSEEVAEVTSVPVAAKANLEKKLL